jgi:hypothetical protein
LEEWAGRILNPHVNIKLIDKESTDRLKSASRNVTFKLNDTNHSVKSSKDKNKHATNSTKNLFNISPDRQKDKTTTELLLAISTTIQQIVSSADKKVSSSKRLSTPAKNDLNKQSEAVSSFIALTNKLNSATCITLEDTLLHLKSKNQVENAITSDKEGDNTDMSEGSSCSSNSSDDDEPPKGTFNGRVGDEKY